MMNNNIIVLLYYLYYSVSKYHLKYFDIDIICIDYISIDIYYILAYIF